MPINKIKFFFTTKTRVIPIISNEKKQDLTFRSINSVFPEKQDKIPKVILVD